jgi:hypothetical protein
MTTHTLFVATHDDELSDDLLALGSAYGRICANVCLLQKALVHEIVKNHLACWSFHRTLLSAPAALH